MSRRILVVGSNDQFSKRFREVFSEHTDFEVVSPQANLGNINLKNLSQQGIDLVCFAGAADDQDWVDLSEVRANWEWLPVIVMVEEAEHTQQYPEVIIRVVHEATPADMVSSLAIKLIDHSRLVKANVTSVSSPAPKGDLGGNFYKTLEIHEVLEKTLSHFGSKILCSDIHWIHWKEVHHIAETDAISLGLELETKYHQTPRLRSWRGENGVGHCVQLAREFPLEEKMQHLETGGFLVQYVGDKKHLLFPLPGTEGGSTLSCLLVEDLHDGEPEFIVKMMRETMSHLTRHIEFSYEFHEKTNMSYIDDLTELYNQRYLPKVLDAEVSRADRNQTKFSVLFMDVDHFKKVNDSNGHWIGSKLLVEIGKIIKDSIRSCDYGFRYGGDEYVILLVDTPEEAAMNVAERLRAKIEDSLFLIDGCKVKLTVSIGLASFPDHASSRQEIIKMADEAMYEGKNKSRNIVVVAS